MEAKISSVERLKAGGDGHSQATQDGHRQREPSLSSGQEGREGEDSKPAGQATRKNHSTLAYMSRYVWVAHRTNLRLSDGHDND